MRSPQCVMMWETATYNWTYSSSAERRISKSAPFDGSPYLSIIVPAYNEARRLPSTLHQLHCFLETQPYTWEVIVVSNGSTDATEDVVRDQSRVIPGLSLLSLDERGKGLAVQAGALAARGEVIFLCDADLSMPAQALQHFLQAIREVDVVAGSREAPGAHRYHEPAHRHVMGRIFNRAVKLLAVSDIEDTQCGFKAFRREAAQALFSRQTVRGWAFDVEILYLARKLGFSIREIPIEWYFNNDTRVRPGVDSVTMLLEVLQMRLRSVLGYYHLPKTRGKDLAG